MSHFELVVEIHREDEDEAFAVARELSRDNAASVSVFRVEPGKTFADGEKRTILKTVEPD